MAEVLDLVGACEYLDLAKTTVYKYVRLGVIPAFKVGKVWRFKKEVLDEWVRGQTKKHTSAIAKKNRGRCENSK
jgi:excisionase family DNA binding protein